MAYKLGTEIKPSRAGEFYGNWNSKLPPVAQFEHEEIGPDHTKVREGRPRPTAAYTSEELLERGWVGFYLKRDLPLPPGAEEIPTPDWMTEPK